MDLDGQGLFCLVAVCLADGGRQELCWCVCNIPDYQLGLGLQASAGRVCTAAASSPATHLIVFQAMPPSAALVRWRHTCRLRRCHPAASSSCCTGALGSQLLSLQLLQALRQQSRPTCLGSLATMSCRSSCSLSQAAGR